MMLIFQSLGELVMKLRLSVAPSVICPYAPSPCFGSRLISVIVFSLIHVSQMFLLLLHTSLLCYTVTMIDRHEELTSSSCPFLLEFHFQAHNRFDLFIQGIVGRHVQFLDLTDHSVDSLSSCLFHRAHSSRHCSSRTCLLAAAASSISPERRGSSASGFLWMFDSSNRCE